MNQEHARVLYFITTVFWIVGRCKSSFHQFIQDVMERVQLKVASSGTETKPVFLPHCTWDKFGDILANSGGRSFGLFDELVSFFTTMNMYSTTRMQVSDTKEYQDLLQMFTGKTKTRETSKYALHPYIYNNLLEFYNILKITIAMKIFKIQEYQN